MFCGKTLSAKLSYQAAKERLKGSKRTPFQGVGIKEIIRSMRPEGYRANGQMGTYKKC